MGEVYRALVLGTGDYVRKNGFSKVIIGLSGGIDSSLTACVAVEALGGGNVLGVAMPSRYSSEGSIADTKVLTGNLGIELWVVPIEAAHGAFLDMLDPYFRGTKPNVAEENVQARIRGNVLMSLSNKYGWLVLTTGNKSELAMGYATLYGDMVGGFAVIKDAPKTLVNKLARWRNEHCRPANPIPQAILDKPPSAELKPDQTDQDTLPPYEVLDPVVKAYVEDDRGYLEMVAMGFDPQVVKQVIGAVDRNEYKRRQAAPGVKITPRAFGRGPPPAHRQQVQAVLVLHLHDHLYLDAAVAGQAAHPHGRPGVAASFPVQVHQEVRCAVGNAGLVAKLGRRVDHAEKLDHPPDLVQVTHVGLDARQAVQHRPLSRLVSLVDGHLSPPASRS